MLAKPGTAVMKDGEVLSTDLNSNIISCLQMSNSMARVSSEVQGRVKRDQSRSAGPDPLHVISCLQISDSMARLSSEVPRLARM